MMFPFIKEAVSQLFSNPSTELYPKEKKESVEGYRGRITYDASACIGCGMCIKACSPTAITKTVEKKEGGDDITFTFDLLSCTFCQMCADFCPKKCIKLTNDYAMIGVNPEDLIVKGTYFKAAPVKKPPVQKPAVEKPAVEKPAVEKPAVEKPAVEKPADEKPADEKPAVEKNI